MMVNPSCPSTGTTKAKTWLYDEYYVGEKDQEERKNGQGENHWSGAKSLEWYTGHLLRDTMHGIGEYRWRHIGDQGTHFTYEGRFYCNKMHGYGTMSYPDGAVFTGLFHSNMRWGPGIESQVNLHEDVGLWRGRKLVRLIWRPATPSVAPDLYTTNVGKACVDQRRIMLTERRKKIGETNSAIELMKQFGADPRVATEKWTKLYPKNCTDTASPLCFVEAFERDYYEGQIHTLEEVTSIPEYEEDSTHDGIEDQRHRTYYAWNNNRAIIHMMKHSYTHDNQRNPSKINLSAVISGPRKQFKKPGNHELDCRSLLMSCYVGRGANVVRLINDVKIHPDVSDNLGNSAIMYATCGDEMDIIHFLVEAGANINIYNDSCCTPLGLALLRFVCAQKDISPSGMLQAILPPPPPGQAPHPAEQKVFEWNFAHIDQATIVAGGAGASLLTSKSKSTSAARKIRSSQSLKDLPIARRKTDTTPKFTKSREVTEHFSDESLSEELKMYKDTNIEFEIKINELFFRPSGVNVIPFLFGAHDMVQETDGVDEEPKKGTEKNPKKVASKVIKETVKASKDMMWQSNDKDEFSSIDSHEKSKNETLARIMLTILQLLRDGADPTLVNCPRPALFIAIVSGCAELVKHLVNYGANINEVYNETFGYTPLHIAISREFSYNNLELIRTVLECGADTSHRLRYGDPLITDILPEGPTLLHAVLARKTENDGEDEIKRSVLTALLEHNCNPLVQFKGRSAIDVAMSKSMDFLDVIIRNPIANLNAPINDLKQTVLVKMFTLSFFKTILPLDRLQTLTNLLLYGADPLIACTNDTEEYPNIFVYAYQTLRDMESGQPKVVPVTPPAKGGKNPESKTPVKKETLSSKSIGKMAADDVSDYKQAIDLVTECARLLHVRWLQAKLVKELVEIIDRYKHRQWNMILKEHKRKKSTGLWLTTQRCLEIWDILKMTRRKVYKDDRVLKHLLYIVQYYNRLNKIKPSAQPNAEQKCSIECNVHYLLRERMAATKLTNDMGSWKRPYVKPELTSIAEEHKFNICFECALPFSETRVQCVSCKLVAFCSFDCMRVNMERVNCHPCSNYLKLKYFPSPSESETQITVY